MRLAAAVLVTSSRTINVPPAEDVQRAARWILREAEKAGIASFSRKGALVRFAMERATAFFGRTLTARERQRVLDGARLVYGLLLAGGEGAAAASLSCSEAA